MISVLFIITVTIIFYIAFEQFAKEDLPVYSKVMLLVAAYCAAYYLLCIIQVIS